MKRIQVLTLKNFKAFQDQKFELKGKHALIYGNNGSGKSSIYWALYTLLESVTKAPAQIAKYFVPYNEADTSTYQSIRNRYGTSPDASVKIDWEDKSSRPRLSGSSEIREFMASSSDVALGEANLTSDFITYRLFQHFNGSNRHDVDVWPAFVRDILPYHKTTLQPSSGITSNSFLNFIEALEYLIILRNKREQARRKRGANRQPTLQAASTEFDTAWATYGSNLRDLISAVVLEANNYLSSQSSLPAATLPFLQMELSYNGGFTEGLLETLSMEDLDLWTTILRNRVSDIVNIKLSVKIGDGTTTREEMRPQTYLNEARLTRLAFALRIGALMVRARTAQSSFNVLCFDDVLISLDMGNRLEMLDWLFTATLEIPDPTDPMGITRTSKRILEYYQVIFLTHERSLFATFNQYLNKYKDNGNWCVWELHGNSKNTQQQPKLITQQSSHLEKAQAYFNNRNYTACANSLRSYCEQKVKKCLSPDKVYKPADGGELKTKSLEELLTALMAHLNHYNTYSGSPLADLFMYKDLLLNPLSHDNDNTTVFADELQRLLNHVMPAVSQLEREQRVGDVGATPFEVSVVEADTQVPARRHVFTFILREPWYIFSFPGGIKKPSNPKAKLMGHSIDGTANVISLGNNWEPIFDLYQTICSSQGITPRTLDDIIPPA